jgi:hypothetical protein
LPSKQQGIFENVAMQHFQKSLVIALKHFPNRSLHKAPPPIWEIYNL